jgi:hypothetical protein
MKVALDIAPVIRKASAGTHKHGLEYFFWKRPEIVAFDDSHVCAKVRGGGHNIYEVIIEYDAGEGTVSSVSCSCPAYRSHPGPCKHIIATLYAMIAGFGKGFEPPAHEGPEPMEPPAREASRPGGIFSAAPEDVPDDASDDGAVVRLGRGGPEDFWSDPFPDDDGEYDAGPHCGRIGGLRRRRRGGDPDDG